MKMQMKINGQNVVVEGTAEEILAFKDKISAAAAAADTAAEAAEASADTTTEVKYLDKEQFTVINEWIRQQRILLPMKDFTFQEYAPFRGYRTRLFELVCKKFGYELPKNLNREKINEAKRYFRLHKPEIPDDLL